MSGRLASGSQLLAALRDLREPAPAQAIARQPYYPWLVVGTTCIGAFIGQLDASIVQLALPALEREFDARLSAVSWVALAYSLAFASILPVFARMSEIVGRKLLYLIGYAVFTLASAACGLASDLTLLIGFRILQGIGGALLGANSITILVKAAGSGRRARAMGLFAAAQAVGVCAGPVVGGLLLSTLGWRWVFWAAVPFGLAAAAAGWFVLPRTGELDPDRRFDWRGALLLMPALTSVIIVLSEIHALGPSSPTIIASSTAAALLLAVFVWHEHRTPAPLLDLRLFRRPAFSGGILAIVLSYALLYGMFFLMSFAFVRGYHDRPLAAGLRLAIIPVALGMTAPFSGALCERFGPRPLTAAGMTICVASLAWLSAALSGPHDHMAAVAVGLAGFGIGLGAFIAPNNNATMVAAPADRAGEAGGLLNLMRVFSTSVGVAVGASVLSWRLEALTGIGNGTLAATSADLLAAVRDVLLLLVGFAVIAGVSSTWRSHTPAALAAPGPIGMPEA